MKVVVRSSDEQTAKAFQTDKTLQGEIGRFVAAARQKLEGLEGGGAVKQLPQGTVRFVKNGGQEQLIAVLRPPEPSPAPAPAQASVPEVLPDACVVDIVVPSPGSYEYGFAFEAIAPTEYKDLPFEGEAEYDFTTDEITYSMNVGSDKALMRASRHYLGTGATIPITARVASLAIDLRETPPDDPVVIDVYGQIIEGEQEITKEFELPRTLLESVTVDVYADDSAPSVFYTIDGSPAPGGVPKLDPLGNPYLGNNTAFSAAMPNYWMDTLFNAWIQQDQWDVTWYNTATFFYEQQKFDDDLGILIEERRFIITISGAITTLPAGSMPSGVPGRRYRWTINAEQATREWSSDAADPAPADVVHAFYYGDPEFTASFTPQADNAGIWTTGNTMPERAQVGTAAVKSSLAGSTGFADLGGFGWLGQLTINRRAATVSWEQA